MDQQFIGFYFTVIIITGMVAYDGIENTYNIFSYINIQIRDQVILIEMTFMRYKLRRALEKPLKQFKNNG